MSHRHKLKIHRWTNGVLETVEHFFESLEEALLLAKATDGHSFKIYNGVGEVVHAGNTPVGEAYAG